MIRLENGSSKPKESAFALSVLLDGAGIDVAESNGGSGSDAVRLVYGHKAASGDIPVVHIPEDPSAWVSRGQSMKPSTHWEADGGPGIRFREDLAAAFYWNLTGQCGGSPREEDAERGYTDCSLHDSAEAVAGALREALAGKRLPLLRTSPWPWGKPFALMLSHDVDQVYDREIFRVLADINHLRRTLFQGEPGHGGLCVRRIGRSLFHPKTTGLDIRALLEIESRHGWRSTCFLMDGHRWRRYGARYRLEDPDVMRLVGVLRESGCEIGLHGGYYDFNSAGRYRASAEKLVSLFGIHPFGIRNHYLRWSHPETWSAQAQSGFEYDSTFGFGDALGFRGRYSLPFWTGKPGTPGDGEFLELPLAVMDASLFNHLALREKDALSVSVRIANAVRRRGGLLVLLWHNNYFDEPEYAFSQRVYEGLLQELAAAGPWCATGGEIARWWRARSKVRTSTVACSQGRWSGSLETSEVVEGLELKVECSGEEWRLDIEGAEHRVAGKASFRRIVFPRLIPGQRVSLSFTDSPSL